MTDLLANYWAGRWQSGSGAGTTLTDPVLGTPLVRVDASGLDLRAGFEFARNHGGAALRALSYRQRAALLGAIVKVLQANRDAYFALATANSGTTQPDCASDIDGAIYTLGSYAKLGETLGERHYLLDGELARLGKDASFQSQHVQVPTRGLALFINAFNFPAWGLWEKAGPALLSGVPVVVKPATSTAWLTQRMVKDVIDAGVLPAGALSICCGSSAGLLDALQPFDVLSFTGSADTAHTIRQHAAIAALSVRTNIEADSINSALLLPDADAASMELLVKEAARDMTAKSGQKCTAIRRILVPASQFDDVAAALAARLAKTSVGNPRNETVRMGSLVSKAQLHAVRTGLAALMTEASLLHDGRTPTLVDADADVACCIGPTLLGVRDADAATRVHNSEVFGPVATVIAYRDLAHAHALVRRGEGSLAVSLFGDNTAQLAASSLELADCTGRVHIVSPDVAGVHTGHANVMPQSLHGGPGRAGGGEELGGLRALNFYHRRSALQASTAVLEVLRALPAGS